MSAFWMPHPFASPGSSSTRMLTVRKPANTPAFADAEKQNRTAIIKFRISPRRYMLGAATLSIARPLQRAVGSHKIRDRKSVLECLTLKSGRTQLQLQYSHESERGPKHQPTKVRA